MKVFGLFAGIGGFERPLASAGVKCAGFCEIDPVAQAVLQDRYPGVPIAEDVTKLEKLPRVSVLTAGFPCQDLSQAGPKVGISGSRSKLVDHVFRLLESSRYKPEWVILENVSYMLRLNRGGAMKYLLQEIERLGFNWAYRVLDARSFGLPQRRERVMLLMSKKHDPSEVLFPDQFIEPPVNDVVGSVDESCYYGFYWTEGKRGLGWTKNAVPTIKGGSSLGIPSPPAVWCPDTGFFGTPTIEDAERLFGYPRDWTIGAAAVSKRKGARWKLVGNTICPPMVEWVYRQMQSPQGLVARHEPLAMSERPPTAAFGMRGDRWRVDVSTWPVAAPAPNLKAYLQDDLIPLSVRAAAGFYSRAQATTTIRFADGFLDSLAAYIEQSRAIAV